MSLDSPQKKNKHLFGVLLTGRLQKYIGWISELCNLRLPMFVNKTLFRTQLIFFLQDQKKETF